MAGSVYIFISAHTYIAYCETKLSCCDCRQSGPSRRSMMSLYLVWGMVQNEQNCNKK